MWAYQQMYMIWYDRIFFWIDYFLKYLFTGEIKGFCDKQIISTNFRGWMPIMSQACYLSSLSIGQQTVWLGKWCEIELGDCGAQKYITYPENE